jgi:hypothetical protein
VRIRDLAAATLAIGASLALGGCSLLNGTAKTAATTAVKPNASPAPTTVSTYSPAAGPIEPAGDLPQQCSQILTTAQLQAVFGAGFPIGVNYGSYAPLTSIGRTGRVVCVFGVGLDSFGRQSSGAIEVSMATYTSAADAIGRAADTVQSDSEGGATEASVSVGGHPATIVVEQTAVGATASAGASSAGASSAAAASSATSPAATSATASATGSAAADDGETELVMADGNRTFVLQIPFAKLAAQQAVTALTGLALEAYQNTLPAAAISAVASPSKA